MSTLRLKHTQKYFIKLPASPLSNAKNRNINMMLLKKGTLESNSTTVKPRHKLTFLKKKKKGTVDFTRHLMATVRLLSDPSRTFTPLFKPFSTNSTMRTRKRNI